MAFVKANPDEYLIIGRNGKVVNRGTGVNIFLWPGSVAVVVPSTKQETVFEMTQESKDGIPLHFRGIVVYRITDPVSAAMNFNFSQKIGLSEISMMINNICLGELRAMVAQMTMQECIEQRKTTLTGGVEMAIRQVTNTDPDNNRASNWGISIEVVQVAQVYIKDPQLRQQLESEVRNTIRARSDQSNIRMQEEVELTKLASGERMQAQRLETEKEALRYKETLDLAKIVSLRRLMEEEQATERQGIDMAREKFRLQQAAEQEKIESETPVQLMRFEKQRMVLETEFEMRQLENRVAELTVQRDMLLETARQNLRKEMIPLEQPQQVAEALSQVFQGTNLSVYGGENILLSLLAPILNSLNNPKPN